MAERKPTSTPRKLHSLICGECTKPFTSTDRKRKCCGRECGWKMGRRNQNVYRARQAEARHARTCKACGRAFTMSRPSGRANLGHSNEGQFCSKECAGSGKRWPSRQDRRREMRRSKKRAGFTPRAIFERDGWRCGICADEVKASAVYPHPKSACVNLIVPPSKGGKRTLDNVMLAHLTCAVHRRARLRDATQS